MPSLKRTALATAIAMVTIGAASGANACAFWNGYNWQPCAYYNQAPAYVPYQSYPQTYYQQDYQQEYHVAPQTEYYTPQDIWRDRQQQNWGSAMNEMTPGGTITRGVTGVSPGAIIQNGPAGGPNSEVRKAGREINKAVKN